MKYILISFALLVLFVIGTWMIAIPEETILGLIANSLSDSTMQIECNGFKKNIFFGFNADSISIKKNDRTFITVENVSGHISLFQIVRLKLPLILSGTIGDGRIAGTAELLRGDREISLTIDGTEVASIPFFDLLGLKGSSRLSGTMVMQNGRGDIQFDMKDTHFVSGTFGSISIPLNDFRKAQGALEIRNAGIKVKSFTMEGPGIYSRIKGDITGGKMNLTLELMPEKSFTDKNLVFSLLAKYMVTPGFYSVPLTNQLNF